MKKIIFTFVLALLLPLSACSAKENADKKEISTSVSSSQLSNDNNDISSISVKYYLEKITGKIMLLDQYERGSNKYISQLLEAENDVKEAVSEIKEDNYTLSTETASGALLELSDTVNSMISSGLDANYSNVYELSKTLGAQTSNITNKFGDGNLPPNDEFSYKSITKIKIDTSPPTKVKDMPANKLPKIGVFVIPYFTRK